MENLKENTISILEWAGYRPADIVFIGAETSGYQCTWDEFLKLADRVYNDHFGAPQVAEDLIIVFNDGALLVRYEGDDCEGWKLISPFNKSAIAKPIKSLFAADIGCEGWCELEEINEEVTK